MVAMDLGRNNDHMKKIVVYLIIAVGLLFTTTALATPSRVLPERVVVITSTKKPVLDAHNVTSLLRRQGKSVTFHNLDDVDALEAQWSVGLPDNEAKARKDFEERLSVVGVETFEAQFKKAYEGLLLALRHQIDRYPAIIFDDHYVVYGVAELGQALNVYQRYRTGQGK